MNTTKHVVLLTSNVFGRGFDSRRLHQIILLRQRSSNHRRVPACNLREAAYFAASCAQFASVVRKGFAAGGGSTSPVNAALKVTMWPYNSRVLSLSCLITAPFRLTPAKPPRAGE